MPVSVDDAVTVAVVVAVAVDGRGRIRRWWPWP